MPKTIIIARSADINLASWKNFMTNYHINMPKVADNLKVTLLDKVEDR